jgi:ATP synthase subunit 6
LIPYSITVTSHLIITLYFSLSFFIGTNIISILYHKEKYFELFLPEGIPVAIIPALIILEYISYISKIFSLAIRLFANMMSGHILLKILIGFSWTLFTNGLLGGFLSIIPFGVVFLVIGLEFVIAFLQAYVFTILLIIYLNDAINIH